MQSIPLDQLTLSPLNVRLGTPSATGIAELAASIESHGLLQPLIVHRIADNKYGVLAGGRRLRALELIDKACLVPCIVRDDDDTVQIEMSIVENTHREALRPTEEFHAFKALAAKGAEASEIATRFGVSERHVKQRMRLGQLHDSVLTALSNDKITLESAMAYASNPDTNLQALVFKEQSKEQYGAHQSYAVRKALATQAADNKAVSELKFVGRAAYLKAGGIIEQDLFGDFERILNPEIIEQLMPFAMKRAIKKLAKDLPDNVTVVDGHDDDRLGDRFYAWNSDDETKERGYPLDEPVFAAPGLSWGGEATLTFFYPAEFVEDSADDSNEAEPVVIEQPVDDGLTKRATFEIDAARVGILQNQIRFGVYESDFRIDLYLYAMADRKGLIADEMGFYEFHELERAAKAAICANLFAELVRTKDNYGQNEQQLATDILGGDADSHTRCRDMWQPTAAFFDLFKKQQLIDMVREADEHQSTLLSNMKLADLRARVLKLFTTPEEIPGIDDETRARLLDWVPAVLKFRRA